MPRTKGQDGSTLKMREDLEAALGALADHRECSPRVMIRVAQAIRRAGLDGLLSPALEDLERMIADVADAQGQVCAALSRMKE